MYEPGQDRQGVNWFKSRQFALVTVAAPERGAWTLQAPDSARTRVSVISDLRLEVDPLPNSLPAGRATELGIRLRDSGQVITSAELLELFAISVTITGPQGYAADIDVSGSYPPPATGEYRVAIPAFEAGGRYQLTVKLNGKILQRELPMYVEVVGARTRPSISTRSEGIPEDDLLRPALTVGAVFLVAIIAILWTVRRRRLRRLALWKQRFQQSGDEPGGAAVVGLRAEPDEEPDREPHRKSS